ncbi:Zinc finger LIM-type [Trinorchestia longiramus]|nr:Zinc finger LIM-type [Trinorchestia longiramus]
MPATMMNLYENLCQRCGRTVYQVDRIGPLKDFTFYHTNCFKCAECGSKLTLKTYCNNQNDQDDKEVYCSSHVPKIGPGHVDGDAVQIRSALNVPRSSNYTNDQIRGKPSLEGEPGVRSPHRHGSHSSSENGHNSSLSDYKYGRFDHTALHIAHALNATKLQKSYLRGVDRPIDSFLLGTRHVLVEMDSVYHLHLPRLRFVASIFLVSAIVAFVFVAFFSVFVASDSAFAASACRDIKYRYDGSME